MDLGNGLGDLMYSTLVHPADTWEEMWHSLTTYVPAVKKRISPDKPFAVSLRLSAKSADRLIGDQAEREKLKAFLGDNDMYLCTANAFPYGPFKGQRVKEQVYEPDWRSDERAQYSINVAEILADVAPPGSAPSIQSPPLGFKPRVTGDDVVEAYTRQVLRVVSHLIKLERRSGRAVKLALEPEPYCFLETTPEVIDYFTNHLYADSAAETVAAATGLARPDAHDALRKHLGVVFDICHQAVEYENIGDALGGLKGAGIPVFKLQAAAALWLPEVTAEAVEALRHYDDDVYLHQTIERRDGKFTSFIDLPDAFEAWERDPGPREWRTHFHVPVFLENLGAFKTTRSAIEDALKVHLADPVSDQLEIETYTWDVLPDHLKTGDITEYVSRELEWVLGELGMTAPGQREDMA